MAGKAAWVSRCGRLTLLLFAFLTDIVPSLVQWTVLFLIAAMGGVAPDYMTSVLDGGFYGWPYSYYGQHVDDRIQPARPDLVSRAIPPDYALGPHTASIGLTFYEGNLLPARYAGGAFIGQHGSWNRKPRSGYRVIFVPFVAGRPSGPAEDVLTGFVDDRGYALGRPVGVVVDRIGALLVADDVGNVIWRVAPNKGGLDKGGRIAGSKAVGSRQ